VLSVLEEVARCGTGVTAREVNDNLLLPRATIYRLLNLLVQDEYLVRYDRNRLTFIDADTGFTDPIEKIRDPGATLQTLQSTTARPAPLLA